MGQHDRAFIADGVFAWFRRRRSLNELAQTQRPGALALAVFVRELGIGMREWDGVIGADDLAWLASSSRASRCRSPPPSPPTCPTGSGSGSARPTATPSARRSPARGSPRAARPAHQPAKDHARRGAAALAASGLDAEPTPYSPLGLRVAGRPALARHPLFVDGAIEVQDEGSQLVCFLLAPKRIGHGRRFLRGRRRQDAVAGRADALAGPAYAFDTHERRLANLKPRLARSGLSNVHPQRIAHERDTKVKRLAGKIDRVLVDAPCTGFGTLRRNPDLKWRQQETALAELAAKQQSILAAAARW